MESLPEVTAEQFFGVDIRAGRVLRAEAFPEARNAALKLWIDFGPAIGERQTSAQITAHYRPEDLPGRTVVGVVNFPPKRVAGFRSEVLVLGVYDTDGEVVLLAPDHETPPGSRVG